MIEEMKANKCNIDDEFAAAEEKRLKHDVMGKLSLIDILQRKLLKFEILKNG